MNFKCIGDVFSRGKHTKCFCLFHRFSLHKYELQFRQKRLKCYCRFCGSLAWEKKIQKYDLRNCSYSGAE